MDGLSESEGIQWSRYIDAIWRHSLLILALALLGSLVGLYAARRVKLSYDANATIWINTAPNGTQQTQTGPIRQPQLLTSAS